VAKKKKRAFPKESSLGGKKNVEDQPATSKAKSEVKKYPTLLIEGELLKEISTALTL